MKEHIELIERDPFQISEHVNSKTYTVYLNEAIVEADRYCKLFTLLRSAGECDIVKIHINCMGGDLFTGVQLITCMKQSAATIHTELDGQAMSLAPLILFAGDDITISENSIIMFHNYSSMMYGKGNEQVSSASAFNEFYRNTMMKYARPFLDEAEIDQIMDGKDLYFGDDEINRRIDLINEDIDDEDEDEDITPSTHGQQLEFDFEQQDDEEDNNREDHF